VARTVDRAAFAGLSPPAARLAVSRGHVYPRYVRLIFARLRTHFDEQEALELTALAAFQNLSSKRNAALGVPAQGFCPAPAHQGRA
jgi:alkylhydroperoxidase family enzyme